MPCFVAKQMTVQLGLLNWRHEHHYKPNAYENLYPIFWSHRTDLVRCLHRGAGIRQRAGP